MQRPVKTKSDDPHDWTIKQLIAEVFQLRATVKQLRKLLDPAHHDHIMAEILTSVKGKCELSIAHGRARDAELRAERAEKAERDMARTLDDLRRENANLRSWAPRP